MAVDRIVRVHSDVAATCQECNTFLSASLDVDQRVLHYQRYHGYVRIRERTQTILAQRGARETKVVVLRRPARRHCATR